MNTFNWKMVVAAVLTMFLSTACSKKLMPPEIETSNGGVESSDFTASNGTSSGGDEFGGSGGPGDSGFFSEEPIVEGSGSGNGGSAGMMADGAGSASGPDGIGGNSMGGFGSSGRADIDNGSSGAFGADNPFASNDSGTGTGGNGSDGFGSSGRADIGSGGGSGSNDHRLNSFHATNDLKDIHFNFDQYDLDSNSKKVLEANASFLKSNPDMRVEIQGHCDERGTNNYNIALGERRAHSTKKYLVAQGVDSSRVNIISYGEEKPFCSDSNENCWFQNRRAHFMVAR